ncbi:trypsin [Clostridium sp. CAG:1013]|nr:trypsin [Clostridium sp. CAG:1013]
MSRGLKVFLWITSALVAGTVIGFSAFVISWAVAGPGWGQSLVETLPESPAESQSPTQEEEESAPQVEQPDVDVTPNTEGILIQKKPQGDPMDAQEVYDKVVKSTVAITASYDGESTDSSGTGIIATSDGYIITNSHVVLNTKNVLVTVTTYDGQQYDAVVVGTDRTTDLAVIKTNDHNFTPAEFGDAEELSIGEWVLAIGNPGGERFASSLTRGIISGLDRAVQNYSEEGMTFIQTDAAINPGNSGGPLVNMYGQVVGINSSKIITEGYEGMGFAIPVSKAKDILDQLLSGGYVEGRVRLGITGYDVTSAQSSFYGLPRGFMIASIDEDSAFAGTDAQVDDIIVALDGEPVQELSDISNLLLRYSPGDQVTVTLYRIPANGMGEGEEIEVTITLLEDKGETQG